MNEEELEKAKKEARSVGAFNIPVCPELLGIVEKGDDKIYFYKDKAGKYFFESERTMKFEQEMKDAQKRRRQRRYDRQKRGRS